MPADHPLIIAAATESGLVQDTLRNELVKRMPFTIGPTETLNDFAQSIGSAPLTVINAATGILFFYDETDTTTADDGITCLVDGLGRRYKVQETATISVKSVLAIASAPPGSPSLGDAYVVDVAPTGAWAAKAKNIAIWTARGWVYAAPQVGTTLLNQDTGLNIQYSAAGSWGEFSADIAAGSITPTMLEFPTGIIVETTESTPPGAPTTGKFWIVGSVPTGAFVGHEADLAYWTGSAWAFLDPAEGWSAYNKQAGFEVYYTSGSWLGATGSEVQTFSTAGAATWTKPAKGTMALIQCWGAGGSGGKSLTQANGADGGGGGAYVERWVNLAALGATESVTVGAGGPAATSAGNGNNGANSTFGSFVTAYGGDAGGGGSSIGSAGMNGGAGGGLTSRGSSGTGGTPQGGAVGAGSVGEDSLLGGGGGGKATGTAGRAGGNSIDGGGGGGANGDGGSGNPAAGGTSFRGGGGGGSRGWAMAGGAGGVSQFGGNGGAGATAGGNGTAGAQPGGGGGGSESGNSGKGGDGRVRVTVV